MYVLLVLALADPPWEEIPPDERAEIVGWWFALTSCEERVRLLNVQQIALGDYQAARRRLAVGLRGGGPMNADHTLVQDYWREWHVVVGALGNDRYMTACQRVVAEREPVPLLGVPGEQLRLCARCREVQAAEVESQGV